MCQPMANSSIWVPAVDAMRADQKRTKEACARSSFMGYWHARPAFSITTCHFATSAMQLPRATRPHRQVSLPAMLEQRIQQHFIDSADLKYQSAQTLSKPVAQAVQAVLACVTSGGKVLACGNG